MKKILGIEIPPIFMNFLDKIKPGEIFNIDGTGIDFYSLSDLEERNTTYSIQEEEPDFLMIGQDGDLAFFIRNGEENIYSNDLGAVGVTEMKIISDNIEEFVKHDYRKFNWK